MDVFISTIPGEKPWAKARSLGLRTVPLATFKRVSALRDFIKKHHIQILNAHTGSTHSLAVAAALGQNVAVVRTRSDARPVRSRVGTAWIYRHTPRVIAAAEYIRRSFVDTLGISEKKVVTIYQSVEQDEIRMQSFPTTPTLGILARLDPVKGHRYAIEALSLLKGIYPKIRLRIMGQEENIKQSELRDIAERLRIEEMVEFMGYEKNIHRAMGLCSVGLITSIGSEAVSRAALEWMAAGRPVIATTVGCLPEIVPIAKPVFWFRRVMRPLSPARWVAWLHDSGNLEKMGMAGRARVEKLFTREDFAEKTEAVYQDACRSVGCPI